MASELPLTCDLVECGSCFVLKMRTMLQADNTVDSFIGANKGSWQPTRSSSSSFFYFASAADADDDGGGNLD